MSLDILSSSTAQAILSSSTAQAAAAAKTNEEWLLLLFKYIPVTAPAVIFCILYFLIAFPIAFITYRTRSTFMYIVVGTAIAEGVGFAIRLSVIDQYSLGKYMMMTLFILLSPNALALVNYLVLGRVISVQSTLPVDPSEKHWRIPYLTDSNGQIIGARVAKFFFLSDILSFILQGSGGGQMGSGNPDMMKMGEDLMMIGLAVQLAFFAAYSLLTIRVYQTHKKSLSRQSTTILPNQTEYDLSLMNRVFVALACTIVLLTVRNVYRFVEFAQGFDGYLASHEVYFYTLDALLMFGCFIVYAALHFGMYLPHKSSLRPLSPIDHQPVKVLVGSGDVLV